MPRGNQRVRQWRLLQVLGLLWGLAVEDPARELGGQWTHAGRGTTFGLGRYRIRPDGAGGERGA